MAKFINSMGGIMTVDDSRVEEYIGMGYKPVPTEAPKPKKAPARKKTAPKKEEGK